MIFTLNLWWVLIILGGLLAAWVAFMVCVGIVGAIHDGTKRREEQKKDPSFPKLGFWGNEKKR